MLYDLTGSGKSNMAATKTEVPISKLVNKIETKVQQLYIYIYIYMCVCVCVFTMSSYPVTELTGLYCDLILESVIQKLGP